MNFGSGRGTWTPDTRIMMAPMSQRYQWFSLFGSLKIYPPCPLTLNYFKKPLWLTGRALRLEQQFDRRVNRLIAVAIITEQPAIMLESGRYIFVACQ